MKIRVFIAMVVLFINNASAVLSFEDVDRIRLYAAWLDTFVINARGGGAAAVLSVVRDLDAGVTARAIDAVYDAARDVDSDAAAGGPAGALARKTVRKTTDFDVAAVYAADFAGTASDIYAAYVAAGVPCATEARDAAIRAARAAKKLVGDISTAASPEAADIAAHAAIAAAHTAVAARAEADTAAHAAAREAIAVHFVDILAAHEEYEKASSAVNAYDIAGVAQAAATARSTAIRAEEDVLVEAAARAAAASRAAASAAANMTARMQAAAAVAAARIAADERFALTDVAAADHSVRAEVAAPTRAQRKAAVRVQAKAAARVRAEAEAALLRDAQAEVEAARIADAQAQADRDVLAAEVRVKTAKDKVVRVDSEAQTLYRDALRTRTLAASLSVIYARAAVVRAEAEVALAESFHAYYVHDRAGTSATEKAVHEARIRADEAVKNAKKADTGVELARAEATLLRMSHNNPGQQGDEVQGVGIADDSLSQLWGTSWREVSSSAENGVVRHLSFYDGRMWIQLDFLKEGLLYRGDSISGIPVKIKERKIEMLREPYRSELAINDQSVYSWDIPQSFMLVPGAVDEVILTMSVDAVGGVRFVRASSIFDIGIDNTRNKFGLSEALFP